MPSSFSLAGSHFPSPASKTLTGAADGGLTRTRTEEIERRSPNIGEEVCVGEDGRLMKVFVKKGRGVNEDGDAMVCKVCGGQFLQKREEKE